MNMAQHATSVQISKSEQDEFQEALVKMIIIDELPLTIGEQEGFKEFVEASCPYFQIPSVSMIYKDCTRLFFDEKLKLKTFFKETKQRLCLTIDTWTSNRSENFLCITAHFIDDNWDLHKKIIGFTPFFCHDGEEIGRAVGECLHDWEIDNVMAITTANATLDDVAISCVRKRSANTVLDGKFLHMKCVVSFINSMVKDVLNEHDDSITRVRTAVMYVKQSPARIEKFKLYAKECGIESKSNLCLGFPTKWNSTFQMLKRAQKFEKVFNLFVIKDPSYKLDLEETCGVPVHGDWQNVRKVATLLKGFYWVTKNILGLNVSSNKLFNEIVDIGNIVTDEMREKYNEYWGNIEKVNMLTYVAVVLDPRYKMELIEFYFEKLYKQENIKGVNEVSQTEDCLWKKMVRLVRATMFDLLNEYSHGNVESKTELDKYLNEECEDIVDNFDILLWWKNNSVRFPILSKIAKDVLAIPASSVAPESAYSIGDNLLDDFRSSLLPSMVETLVCTKDWIHKSVKEVEVEENSTDFDDFPTDPFDETQYE